MSWLFSQALVEEYLGDTSLDGEQSAPLSGNNTQQAYCAPDKMTKFSRLSRFGMTYKPLMETRGEELLTLYLAGFHAKTSQLRGGGAGLDGERSGMWREMARIIGEIRPRYAFVENSPMLVNRGLERVLADLTSMGYDSRWGVFRASTVGASHHRARLYLVANPHGSILESVDIQKSTCFDTAKSRRRQFARAIDAAISADDYTAMPRNPNDVARGMDRFKATGNGQVPAVAKRAWELLK